MSEFKIGDRVELVGVDWGQDGGVRGKVYTVSVDSGDLSSPFCNSFSLVDLELVLDYPEDFKLVEPSETKQTDGGKEEIMQIVRDSVLTKERAKELGVLKPDWIFRPNLKERKVGKVRMELVDKGFPNTLWALAELLTWAQQAKGYKDHDWANIPNALSELPAAASRHRVRHNKGELYDDESGKLHKLHELFGVMAECELLLKGECK
jgi:hypothetical protein